MQESNPATDRTPGEQSGKGIGAAIARLIPGFITPNQISMFRIVGCVGLFVMEITGCSVVALVWVAGIVGWSDLFDGILARARGQITKLGAILDPVGDKLFAAAMVWIIWQRGLLEGYLLIGVLLVESHGVWVPLLCLLRRARAGKKLWPPPEVKPNWFGKWKMGWLGSAMGLILLSAAVEAPWLYVFAWWNIWIGLGLGLVAMAIYVNDFAHGQYQ